MKRFLCTMMSLVLLMLTAGCAAPSNEAAVLPPTRFGHSESHASFGKRYTFETAVAEADVIARVEVGNWIAEDFDLDKTYYEAAVLECFKGDIPETFTLLQDGCSKWTMGGYPLFTDGNELVVFLKEAVGLDYSSPYWIIGAYDTVFYVSYDESGNRYYADRRGVLGKTMEIPTNYTNNREVFNEDYARAVADDPIVSEMSGFPYVFAEADVIALLEGK